MKAYLVKQGWLVPGAVVAILVISAIVGISVTPRYTAKPAKPNVGSLELYCPGVKADDMECQKKYYGAKYMAVGAKAVFADLRAQYAARPSVKADCHQITHSIGRNAAAKYADVTKAYADGDEFCWSGYYHGVMEQLLSRYTKDSVVDHLNEICIPVSKGADRYSFKHYNCAHGLGHGIMLIQGDELFDSLTTCDSLKDEWERRSCYGGVFMENIMAHINPDHSTKYIHDDDPLYPCTAVAQKYAEECYLMQTSQALRVLNQDFDKVFALCGTIAPANQTPCYQSLGRDASGNSNSDVTTTHATCTKGPTLAARQGCVVGAVKDFISYYHSDTQATALCASFPQDLASLCTATKKDYYKSF